MSHRIHIQRAGSEDRVTEGTKLDRRKKSPLGVRIKYGIAVLIGIISLYGAGKAYHTAQQVTVIAKRSVDTSRQASSVATAVNAGLAQQTQNRTANVGSWCGAIDTLDTTLVGYVQIFVKADPHIPPLKLTQLDCAALERKTLASTKTSKKKTH